MKTIIFNNSNLSVHLFEDNDTLTMSTDNIICPNFIIGDMNSNNATIYEDVTPPEDWRKAKYLFDGSTWSDSPNWEDLLKVIEENNKKYNLTGTGEPS